MRAAGLLRYVLSVLRKTARGGVTSPSRQLSAFYGKYDPAIARLGRAAVAAVKRLMPRATVLVYDNYNALVIGFATSDRASDAIMSVALYPRWVTLFFFGWRSLPNPDRLVTGSGKIVRQVRLTSAAALADPRLRRLIAAAVRIHAPHFGGAGRGALVIKSVSARQRPRRPDPGRRARR